MDRYMDRYMYTLVIDRHMDRYMYNSVLSIGTCMRSVLLDRYMCLVHCVSERL